MSKVFCAWKTDEVWLLPPSVADFVPGGHPAHLVRDLVSEELDLWAIMGVYTEVRGYPPYRPAMMVALLLDAYRSGVYSSRRIARACEERLDLQAVTALNQPDFRTISEFRRRHLDALADLFVQVLALKSPNGWPVRKRTMRPSRRTGCATSRRGSRASALQRPSLRPKPGKSQPPVRSHPTPTAAANRVPADRPITRRANRTRRRSATSPIRKAGS